MMKKIQTVLRSGTPIVVSHDTVHLITPFLPQRPTCAAPRRAHCPLEPVLLRLLRLLLLSPSSRLVLVELIDDGAARGCDWDFSCCDCVRPWRIEDREAWIWRERWADMV